MTGSESCSPAAHSNTDSTGFTTTYQRLHCIKFDLFSQIENKVSQYQHLWLIRVYSCSYYYLIYHFLVIITEVKKIILINQ